MIEAAYVLALDKRKDLIPPLEKQVNDLFGIPLNKFWVGEGEDPSIEYNWIDKDVFPTNLIDNRPGGWNYGTGISSIRHYRAHISHKKIISYAESINAKNLLLLEDDAIFLPRAKNILEKLEKNISYLEYDLIYIGHHAWQYFEDKAISTNIDIEKAYEEKKSCYLYHVSQVGKFNIGGFHAVIINNSAYPKLLSLPARQPLDSMVNANYPYFNRFLICPKIVADPQGFSYCDNREVKR